MGRNLFHRWICSGRGMRLFPETQVLKDLFDDIRLVDEANDAHFPLALNSYQSFLIDKMDKRWLS